MEGIKGITGTVFNLLPAGAWWFLLMEVLGYKNVKNYDGSMEEWTKDPAAPVEP